MNDIYTCYEQGANRLLEHLSSEHDLFLDVCSFQHSLNLSIHKLRIYGDDDLGGNANLLRSLRQLDKVCLEIYKMSFNVWCNRIAVEVQDEFDVERDPLYPYIGDWQSQQDGKLQHFLRGKLNVHIDTKRAIPEEDQIERFRNIPLHAMFLYTLQDPTVFPYIQRYWDALESQFRDICEIHISVAQLNGSEDGNDAIRSSYILKKFGFHAYTLLPGIFFWDLHENSEFVSFGRNASESEITYLCRLIFEKPVEGPSIATIRRVKEMIDQSRHDQDLTSNFDGHRYSQNKLLSLPERLPELKQKDPEVTQQLDGTESSSEPPDSKNDDHNKLVEELRRTPMGDGKAYEELVKKILEYCFTGEFSPFQVRKQVPTNNGKRIRDFIIDNRSPKMEFWQSLKRIRGVEKILFDAKNYKDPVEYAQISSTLRYLKTKAFGNFIIIISRCGVKDYEELLEDYLAEERVVLFLGDADLVKMINLKKEGESPTLLIEEKYHALLDMR